MRMLWVWLKSLIGNDPTCERCGFIHVAHFDHRYQFDVDNYPCRNFVSGGDTDVN